MLDSGAEVGTVCVHTDTPDAVTMMRAVRAMLVARGIEVTPP
jgi:lactam utilization protein B